jgi:hypothetical protein
MSLTKKLFGSSNNMTQSVVYTSGSTVNDFYVSMNSRENEDDIFKPENWKHSNANEYFKIVLTNLNLDEFKRFFTNNFKHFFSFAIPLLYNESTIEKIVRLNLINVNNLMIWYFGYSSGKSRTRCEEFVYYLFYYLVQLCGEMEQFEKYIRLTQVNPNYVIDNYELAKFFLKSEHVDVIFGIKHSFNHTRFIKYMEIMRDFNKVDKLQRINELLKTDTIRNEEDFAVLNYWTKNNRDFIDVFLQKIYEWKFSKFFEKRKLVKKDIFLKQNLTPEHYYMYCEKYQTSKFNYRLIYSIIEKQAVIEEKLNKILNRLEIE